MQRRPNVFDAGPTLYDCYTNILCLLGKQRGVLSRFAMASYNYQRRTNRPLITFYENCRYIDHKYMMIIDCV